MSGNVFFFQLKEDMIYNKTKLTLGTEVRVKSFILIKIRKLNNI